MTAADLEGLFRAHYADLHAFCARRVHDDAVADDLVQGVFLRIWMRRDDLEDGAVGRAYLFRSVRNAAIGWLRKRGPVSLDAGSLVPEALVERTDPDATLGERRLLAVVDRALDDLPDRCREAFLLVRERGLSYREAAEVLGISPKTIDAHMVRAVRALRGAVRGRSTPGESERASEGG